MARKAKATVAETPVEAPVEAPVAPAEPVAEKPAKAPRAPKAPKVYDTTTATVVKKVTFGYYGDPAGYEKTLYRTPEGDYFLYTYGGAASEYATETKTGLTNAKAKKWLEQN